MTNQEPTSSVPERAPAKSFQDLAVWQKAHRLVLGIYRLSRAFPREEVFGLTAQLRRAAVSIAANIAEGFTRRSDTDKARFYNIAQGSLDECRYYLILCRDLGYPDSRALLAELQAVSRLLERYAAAVLRPNR